MIKNGEKVTVKGDGSREVFTVSQLSGSQCWIGDSQGRGWYINTHRLEIAEAEEEPETDSEYCNRCNEKLDPSKIVWLELDQDTGLYTDKELPEGHTSQGGFAFGRACANTVLKNGGRNEKIEKKRRRK